MYAPSYPPSATFKDEQKLSTNNRRRSLIQSAYFMLTHSVDFTFGGPAGYNERLLLSSFVNLLYVLQHYLRNLRCVRYPNVIFLQCKFILSYINYGLNCHVHKHSNEHTR